MTTTHTRRSPEQQIADLQAEIERVRQREAAKEAKNAPDIQALLAYARAGNMALSRAEEAGNTAALEAIRAAQEALSRFLDGEGLAMPKRREKGAKGRRKTRATKSEAA